MDYQQIESSQRQHHEILRHEQAMYAECMGADYKLFSLLKPTLKKDGDEWCCLYGENIAIGIVGYGKTPHEAVIKWNQAWHEKSSYCMPDNVNTKEEHEQYLKDIGVK